MICFDRIFPSIFSKKTWLFSWIFRTYYKIFSDSELNSTIVSSRADHCAVIETKMFSGSPPCGIITWFINLVFLPYFSRIKQKISRIWIFCSKTQLFNLIIKKIKVDLLKFSINSATSEAFWKALVPPRNFFCIEFHFILLFSVYRMFFLFWRKTNM